MYKIYTGDMRNRSTQKAQKERNKLQVKLHSYRWLLFCMNIEQWSLTQGVKARQF